MDQTPAAMDRHLEVVHCHKDTGILLGASSLTGRYWYGSLWYYQNPELAPDVEKCTAGVQLEAGLSDACWVDATRVLVALDTGSIALWELTDNLHTFIQQSSATEHDDIVSSVCVCQSGNTVLSASHDKSVKIWDVETFSSIHTFTAHSDAIHCIQSHPVTPNIFLTASQDGSVCLWDTRNSKPVSRLAKSPLSSIPTCIAWQPGQEHTYAVGSDAGQLVVKDTRSTVTDSVSVTPHHRGITRIQFSPHTNTKVATTSEDCTMMVMDITSGQTKQLYRNTSHKDFVQGVSWSGENTLFTCGWDARVVSHTITGNDDSATQAGEPVKMEVNGESGEPAQTSCVVKDSVKSVQKVQGLSNGDSDQTIATEQSEQT